MGASKSTSSGGGGNKNKTYGMGPAQSMAMAGNTGLATATERQANIIKAATGKSFKAIGQNIGEVGSKYRRPADVEKYAKNLETIEAGKVLGAKTFVGPDGVERVSFVGTGMKDEQGRTILSKKTPELTATAPTLKQLGGDIARGLMGYNTIEYINDKPTMVKKEGLIPSVINAAIGGKFSPISALTSAISTNFFSYSNGNDKGTTTTTTPTTSTEEFADAEAAKKAKQKLAGSLVTDTAKGRSLFGVKARTITGGMS